MPPNGDHEILAVIPARFASTRFPGKVLADIAGKPLVAHTHARAKQAALVDRVVVATDDQRVNDALAPLGIDVAMTRSDHHSGTDRMAEVAENSRADILVNVQGDEPLIDPKAIDAAIQPLLDNADIPMATARRLITDPAKIHDPNIVKVVTDTRGRALYFSRNPIPYLRDTYDNWHTYQCHWQHIGLYVYRREFLLQFASWEPTPLEKLEKLEQLRVLENGYPIAVIDTAYESVGVDSPDDLDRVRRLMETREAGSH